MTRTIMLRLPERSRFSRTHPSGMSMRWPSFATIITVPRSVTFRPKFTSPVTVRWSNSRIFGIFLNRFWNCWICARKGEKRIRDCRIVRGQVTHLLKMVTKLDHGRVLKHPARIDHQLAVLQRIDVTLDQQQIGARFHRKEPAARDVHAVRAFEVLDSCSRCRLELDDRLAIV